MPEITVRSLAKIVLPQPIRRLLRACLHYFQRVARWPIILWQIRGSTWDDQWTLLRSAIAAPFLSLKNLLCWQDPILLADAQVVVRGVGDFIVRARCDDLWHVLPWRESAISNVLRAKLHSGDTFVDAGANIGVYSIMAGRLVGADGKVIAVEMMPETARILRGHISKNKLGNVAVFEKALADVAGTEVIARVPDGRHGQASIANGISVGGHEVRVITTTLADILGGLECVTLMKMDLEGAEPLALVGAGEALKRVQAVIFEDWGNASLSEMFRLNGFSVERLDGNNCLATNLTTA